MVGLELVDTHTNVLIAAAIAHYNEGYFRQNDPEGRITVEADGRLRIEREMIRNALGRPCSDEVWQALAQSPRGSVVEQTDRVIVIEA